MWLVGSRLIRSNVTIPTISYLRVSFSTNDVMFRLHYDVIYHPSRINSQYLKTRGVNSPALHRIGVHTTSDIFSCRHIVVNMVKTVLDSGFHAVDSGLQILDSSLCEWNLDSGFQSLVGFRIPWAVLRIPQTQFSKIPDSTSKYFTDFRIRIPFNTWGEHSLHGGVNLTTQFRSTHVFLLFFFIIIIFLRKASLIYNYV